MPEWERVRLGEVLKLRKEFITIDDLILYKRCRVQVRAQGVVLRDKVTGADIKTKKQQICRAEDFLVAEIDAKVGGFGLVPEELDGAVVSSHYFLFEIDEVRLDKDFLNFYSKTSDFMEQVGAQGSTNYAAIRPAHVLAYTIPLPPLPEQRRIVGRVKGLLESVEEARKLRDKTFDEFRFLLKAEVRLEFEKLIQYDSVSLKSVCTAIIDNLHSNPEYVDSGVPCVRSSDVGWFHLNLNFARRTTEAEYHNRTVRGEPQEHDIVLVREGGGTGKAAIVREGQRFSLGQRVMMLRTDTSKVIPEYFLHQLLSPQIQDDQMALNFKGSAAPHLNIGTLKEFNFILPPIAVQERVVSTLNKSYRRKELLDVLALQTQLELDALPSAILARAFAGAL